MNPRIVGKGQIVRIATIGVFATAFLTFAVSSHSDSLQVRPTPPKPVHLFSPSNAKTEDGELIPTKSFIPAARCATCHADTHRQWSESLHRNAVREPYYKASVNILETTRGSEFIQHCESCHAPVSLFSGALITGSKETREMDDEGITCTVCHSITQADTLGTSSYTIRKPAMLIKSDGTAIGGEASDQDVLNDIESHKRAMMRPLLKSPEFCGACHKSNAPPELNNYKNIRGYSTYDEWQQSGASHESILPFYKKPERMDCRACHMANVYAPKDSAADAKGLIASHRWIGANTAVAHYYNLDEQENLTRQFLQNKVLSVDIFSLRRTASNELVAPLQQSTQNLKEGRIPTEAKQNPVKAWKPSVDNNDTAIKPGEEVIAEVVIFNRGAAHAFPPELRDNYEPWVEFSVTETSTGKNIFHSGFLEQDGRVDERAHVYKAVLLDELGKPFTRHQVWLGTAKAYDAFIPQGRGDLVRYRFRLPDNLQPGAKIRLQAKVHYRRFIKEFADYVSSKFDQQLPNPIVEMASGEAEFCLIGSSRDARKSPIDPSPGKKDPQESSESSKKKTTGNALPDLADAKNLARRWNDYGIALLGQSQYGDSAGAFRRAAEIDPTDSNLLVSAAIAELQTERYGPERSQIAKAEDLLAKALQVEPNNPRAQFYWAIVKRADGKTDEAAEIFAKLAEAYPRDREVQRQLGQTLYRLGRYEDAQKAFLAINRIDPTDSGAYQFLAALSSGSGMDREAEFFQKQYLLWRDDPLADVVANRFYAAHPEWADARTPGKIYGANSPRRPAIVGDAAAAER